MKSIASAPAKIILFGEHFVVHGTPAILAAIDKRVTVTTTFTEDATITINSELGTYWSKLPIDANANILSNNPKTNVFKPFIYLATKLLNSDNEKATRFRGLEITIDSDIPVGVGLGSSSACCVAAAASILRLFDETKDQTTTYFSYRKQMYSDPDRCRILDLAVEAEKTIFPNTSGADCNVCTYGGIIEYEKFVDVEEWRMRENDAIRYDKYGQDISGGVTDLTSSIKNLSSVVSHPGVVNYVDDFRFFQFRIINSNLQHNTKESVENVSKFKKNHEERFLQLCALETKLIDEVKIAMKESDLTTLGLKMSENQKYLEEIQVSNETLRNMINSIMTGVRSYGVNRDGGRSRPLTAPPQVDAVYAGAKITGAGDGGCIIALLNAEYLLDDPTRDPNIATIDATGVTWSAIEE